MKEKKTISAGFFWVLLGLIFLNTEAQLPPETDWGVHQGIGFVNNPGYLESVYDSTFNVNITRISDETVFGNSEGGIQHQYSKVQAWNADMTMISLGFTTILDATDYSLIGTLDIGESMKDGRWSNVDPEIRYFGSGNYLKKVNVLTKEVTTLHEFPGYGTCNIGPWEGNISADDRYVVVTSSNEKNASVYDIENDTILGTKLFPETFDWASVTPWGDYVVVNERGSGGAYGRGVTNLYTLDFTFVRELSDHRAHADFAIDSDGNRVFIEMCPIGMVRMDNGEATDLLPATVHTSGTCGEDNYNPWICGHVSGRNFEMPGWVLISAGKDKCNNGYDGYYHRTEIFLLKLDGSGTIRHFGFTRSSYGDYLAEAKAVVSPDGKKAIFTSDWNVDGYGTEGARDYVVEYNTKEIVNLTTHVLVGSGSISPSGGNYSIGSQVTLTATPDLGYVFDGWGGDLSGSENPVSITMNGDKSVTAAFVEHVASMYYWPMDETSGTILADSSGSGQDVTLSSSDVSTFVDGKINGAIYFDGSRDGEIASAPLFQHTSLTVAAFIKADASNLNWAWIAAHGDNWGLYVTDLGNIQLYYYDGSDWPGVIGEINVRDNEWHHVTGTFDDVTKKMAIYVDGELDKEGTLSGSITYTIGNDFHIASMQGQRNFIGTLDELRIYNKALSQEEIENLYNQGEPSYLPASFEQTNFLSIAPNPFSDETRISYAIQIASEVNISVFELSGRKVAELINLNQQAGRYSLTWEGSDFNGNSCANGIYIVKLQTGTGIINRKLVLNRT